MAVTGIVALDQLQTHVVAGAILAVVLTLGVVIWLEITIRIRQGITSEQRVDLKNAKDAGDMVRGVNQYLAYGRWIPIYRILACVIIVGSVLTIVFTLLF
jgi:hypothetical protein